MRQRSAALLSAVVLLVALGVVAGLVPVPYAVLVPGPACNTVGTPTAACRSTFPQGLIRISPSSYAHPKHDTLDLTTIGELTQVSLFTAVRSYFSAGDAVIPRAVLIPPGQSDQQVNQQDQQQMTQSQDSAAVAAATYLGLDRVKVTTVQAGGPSSGRLAPGDLIERLDGRAVGNTALLVAMLAAKRPGSVLALTVDRGGATRTVSVVAGANPQAKSDAFLGVEIRDVFADGITVSVGLQDVGGPSAGLMLSLGLIDEFEPYSLTGGRLVAGTGTIDDLGNVGSIGGIPQKMFAARHDAHASVFFAPVGDCADARGAIPAGLQVVSVTSLRQALADLAALRAGHTDLPGC